MNYNSKKLISEKEQLVLKHYVDSNKAGEIPPTNAEIAKTTGFNPNTITLITNRLIQKGYLKRGQAKASRSITVCDSIVIPVFDEDGLITKKEITIDTRLFCAPPHHAIQEKGTRGTFRLIHQPITLHGVKAIPVKVAMRMEDERIHFRNVNPAMFNRIANRPLWKTCEGIVVGQITSFGA